MSAVKLLRGGAGSGQLPQAAEPLDEVEADDEPADDEADAAEDEDEPESEPDVEDDFEAESDDLVDGEAGVLLDDDPRLSFR